MYQQTMRTLYVGSLPPRDVAAQAPNLDGKGQTNKLADKAAVQHSEAVGGCYAVPVELEQE